MKAHIEIYGALNLEVAIVRTGKGVTVGFRCWQPNRTFKKVYPAFRINKVITDEDIAAITAEIEKLLDDALRG